MGFRTTHYVSFNEVVSIDDFSIHGRPMDSLIRRVGEEGGERKGRGGGSSGNTDTNTSGLQKGNLVTERIYPLNDRTPLLLDETVLLFNRVDGYSRVTRS